MDSITWLDIFILFSMFILTPIYVLVALIICYYSTKKFRGKKRFLRFILLAFIFYLPIGWDVLLGRGYFYYLCATDGGIHIYETVELGPEYWNEDGSPKFYTQRGEFDESVFDRRYLKNSIYKRNYNKQLNIARDDFQIINQTTGELMGNWTSYIYFGGWLVNSQPFHVSGRRCHGFSVTPDNPHAEVDSVSTHKKFTSYMFVRNNNKEEKIQ